MPSKRSHPCGYPGCPNLTHGRYCESHEKSQRERYNQEHPIDDAGYKSSAWRKFRAAFARTHTVCADPFGDHARTGQVVPMHAVDHIVPREKGGPDAWNNLQALCAACHGRKSALEGSRWGPSK